MLERQVNPWLTLGIILPLFAAFVVYALWFSPGAIQRRNMATAEGHNVKLRSLIAGDARFTQVEFNPYTGNDGCGSVRGTVSSPDDAQALVKLIIDSHPPTVIVWHVTVEPDTAFEYFFGRSPHCIWPDGRVQRVSDP